MSGYCFTSLARDDLDQIAEYIAERNPTAAERLVKLIHENIKRLVEFPEAGFLRSDFGRDIRSMPVGTYIIFYRIAQKEIEVIRILHASRDIPRLFGQ